MSNEKRHSIGGRIQEVQQRRNTTMGPPSERNLTNLTHDNDDDIFEKSEFFMKRPESARVKIPSRDNIFQRESEFQKHQ